MSQGPPTEVARWAAERAAARAARDFGRADELRGRIAGAGWEVLDQAGGYTLRPLRILVPKTDPGFGAARNAALWRAAGEVVVVADTSLELAGDLVGPLLDALADPGVAVAGPFGLTTGNLRDYEERTAGDVAAVQGYALAARRSEVTAVGGFREAFSFYRNADIDLSLRLRDLGATPRRAVAAGADRCRRHAHRAWEATAPEKRDRLSRKTMARVLKRFGDRLDLAVR